MQKNRVQTRNPVTGHYVKINTWTGSIIGHKWDSTPYHNIQTISERESSPEYKEQLEIDNIIKTHHFKIDPKYAKRKVKCDCGHYSRDHYLGEGQCLARCPQPEVWKRYPQCGCTWYSPNCHWIQKQQIKQAKAILRSRKGEITAQGEGGV
jgi:hypothetical protein